MPPVPIIVHRARHNREHSQNCEQQEYPIVELRFDLLPKGRHFQYGLVISTKTNIFIRTGKNKKLLTKLLYAAGLFGILRCRAEGNVRLYYRLTLASEFTLAITPSTPPSYYDFKTLSLSSIGESCWKSCLKCH